MQDCNAEFRKSEILYREFGGEIGEIAFCPHCKEETKLNLRYGCFRKHSNY